MKTSNAAIAFFLLHLSLTTETHVSAKLRSNTEDHRELNHKSDNYYQSKLKNGLSGKCIGFDVVNDVDDGESAKWVNCKRAPTFEFMNPNNAEYFTHKGGRKSKREPFDGFAFHIGFQVGSLSESSSTSDHRTYMCLEGDKGDGLIAKYCNKVATKQAWMPVAVRNQRDTWRLKNAKLKTTIMYSLKEKKEELVKDKDLVAEIKEIFAFDFIDASDFIEGIKNQNSTRRNLSGESTGDSLKIVNSVNPRSVFSKTEVTSQQVETSNEPEFAQPINVATTQGNAREDEAETPTGTPTETPLTIASDVEAFVSLNGTIYDYNNEDQYFVDLDCRYVYGKDPVRNDGWYNGRDGDSTKPPQEDS